jgi:Zn-dependent peptidase ImmA (M78 family)
MDYSTFLLAESQPQPPRWIGRFTKGGTSYAEAELNATLFRKQFCDDDQLSPLYSLPKIVTHQMEILLFVVKGGRLDGASAFFAGLPFVFITERFAPRMLFTLAHELGHLLSHHDAHEDFAFVDRASETEVKGSHATEEQYAHAFASCLLMPRSGIGVALEKIRQMNKSTGDQLGDVDILFLARIYGVSFAAAAKRCEDLGLLPRGGANSLAQYLKAEYGSPEKRAEALGLPKRAPLEFPSIPEQLLGAAISKIRAGEISVGKAAAVLGLSVAELFAANTPTVH